MMSYQDVYKATFFVAKAGGEVSAITPEGEVIWTQGLAGGKHTGKEFTPYMHPSDELRFTKEVTPVIPSSGRARPMAFGPGANESGANPEFRPTAAGTAQRALEHQMRKLTQKTDAAEKRMRAMAKIIERQNPPVIDPGDTIPDPAPDPSPQPDPDDAGAE